ncbi:MAG: hypothetical protein AAGJ94_07800 [Pseudomonadota bacterium]
MLNHLLSSETGAHRVKRLKAGWVCQLCAISLAAVSSQALAAEAPHCGPFKISVVDAKIDLVDIAEPGLGVGDIRTGVVTFAGEGHEGPIHLPFRSHVVPSHQQEKLSLIGQGDYIFSNGTIHWSGTYDMADPTRSDTPPSEIIVPIVGGTGDYAGARGTVRWFQGDDGVRISEFDISCQE